MTQPFEQVPAYGDHQDMSKYLHDEFVNIPAWASVVMCPQGSYREQSMPLWFYPVDNTVAQEDGVICALMKGLVTEAMRQEYITKKVLTRAPS